jgi:hypothetical protein
MAELSFTTVLHAFGNLTGLPIDSTGVPTFTTTEEARYCGRLNDAMRWLWFVALPQRVLPDMLTGATVTLGAGGQVAAADIEGSSFWSVWQSDPRAEVLMDRPDARLRLEASQLDNGNLQVRNGSSGDSVFVFYRRELPIWTTVLFDTTKLYAINEIAWVKEDPDGISYVGTAGHVYKNVTGQVADGSDLEVDRPHFFRPITLPDSLQEIVLRKANLDRLRSDAQLVRAAQFEQQLLTEALESAQIAAEQNPGDKPWLYNYNR